MDSVIGDRFGGTCCRSATATMRTSKLRPGASGSGRLLGETAIFVRHCQPGHITLLVPRKLLGSLLPCLFLLVWVGASQGGPSGESTRVVSGLRVDRVDVRRLPVLGLDFSVKDRSGAPIAGLRSSDFRLFLDGVPVDSFQAWSDAEGEGRTVLFVLESSPWLQGRSFFRMKRFVEEAAERLSQSSKIGLMVSGAKTRTLIDVTGQRDLVFPVLQELSPGGKELFLNTALLGALGKLRSTGARRAAIVLLASGKQNLDGDVRPEVLSTAARLGIPIHAVVADLRFESAGLASYAAGTGGRFYPEPTLGNAVDLVRQALADGEGRYHATIELTGPMDGRARRGVLELFLRGKTSRGEFAFLQSGTNGISSTRISEYHRRARARQQWWIMYGLAILGALLGVRIGVNLELVRVSSRWLTLVTGLAVGAAAGFVLARLG